MKYLGVVRNFDRHAVAPFTGAWIEIPCALSVSVSVSVAPFTGAWIEIAAQTAGDPAHCVAPFTGAWIEIGMNDLTNAATASSLPSRERGLKWKIVDKSGPYKNSRSLRGSVD